MRTSGYGSYRGRSPWKSVLKILAVAVIVLIVLGIASAAYLQQFLVVSTEGVRLELPFFQQEEEPEPDASVPDIPSEPPVVMITPIPAPTPEPEPEPETLSPVPLPREALSDGTALRSIEAAGGDCALFDMKDDEGTLGYASAALTRYTDQTSGSDALNAAIQTLNGTEGLYTIARVSCFRDDFAFYYNDRYPLYANSGDRWIDPDRLHWLAPTNYDVRAYLTQVCVELAELGFDEILLDNAGYPAKGNLHYIRKGETYDSTRFASVIDGFYAQVADALAEYDVRLSVVTTAQAMDGQDTLTGQTPGNLTRFDRLWTADETGALLPQRETA